MTQKLNQLIPINLKWEQHIMGMRMRKRDSQFSMGIVNIIQAICALFRISSNRFNPSKILL